MKIHVTLGGGECRRTRTLSISLGWTVYQLVEASHSGVTAAEMPVSRWSPYVHQIRQKGLSALTKMKQHGSNLKGRHARYGLAPLADRGGPAMIERLYTARPAPLPAPVRRIMLKHGLPEPSARLVAFLAFNEGQHG